MFQYKSKPNTNISVAGRLVKFGPDGIARVNKEEVCKGLDGLIYVQKVEDKVEVEVKVETKPQSIQKKKK